MDPLKRAEGTGGAPTCLAQKVVKMEKKISSVIRFESFDKSLERFDSVLWDSNLLAFPQNWLWDSNQDSTNPWFVPTLVETYLAYVSSSQLRFCAVYTVSPVFNIPPSAWRPISVIPEMVLQERPARGKGVILHQFRGARLSYSASFLAHLFVASIHQPNSFLIQKVRSMQRKVQFQQVCILTTLPVHERCHIASVTITIPDGMHNSTLFPSFLRKIPSFPQARVLFCHQTAAGILFVEPFRSSGIFCAAP
jgi:hypothetical protein